MVGWGGEVGFAGIGLLVTLQLSLMTSNVATREVKVLRAPSKYVKASRQEIFIL